MSTQIAAADGWWTVHAATSRVAGRRDVLLSFHRVPVAFFEVTVDDDGTRIALPAVFDDERRVIRVLQPDEFWEIVRSGQRACMCDEDPNAPPPQEAPDDPGWCVWCASEIR